MGLSTGLLSKTEGLVDSVSMGFPSSIPVCTMRRWLAVLSGPCLVVSDPFPTGLRRGL